MTSPDLSDKDVLDLLDRNHKPAETAVTRQVDLLNTVTEIKVICMKCDLPYPCPTRQAIKEYRVEELRKSWLNLPQKPCGRTNPHEQHSYVGFVATVYLCPGSPPVLDCGRDQPHERHMWTPVRNGMEHECPGTSYELMDCDDAARDVSHDAHSWNYRGGRFWCHGG